MAILTEYRELYRTHDEIVAGIIREIRLREPLWATEPGTPLRKLIDSFAAMLEQITLDAFYAQISWDLESKSGTDLDEFVGLFGFERKKATKSTGFVKFFANEQGGASQRYIIPAGSRVSTSGFTGGVALNFVTTATVVLEQGSFQVEAPIEAEVAGSIYNVEANTILVDGSGAPGVGGNTPIRNENATTGGSDAESDAALRARFRRTLFRNIAGTREAYIGVADRHDAVTTNRVAVYSQTERREDIIQFTDQDPEGNPWPGSEIRAYLPRTNFYFETDLIAPVDGASLPENRIYYTRYTDYVILTDLSGTYVQALAGGDIVDGQVALISYEYKPTVSRADEYGNTRNVVDVYVGGSLRETSTDLQTMDDSKVYNASSYLLEAMTNSQTTLELRDLATDFPVAGVIQIESEYISYTSKSQNQLLGLTRGTDNLGNPAGSTPATHAANLPVLDVSNRVFTKLMFQPVEDVSDTIVVGNDIYYEGTDYQLVHDLNDLGNRGSWRAADGIAWETGSSRPVDGTQFRVDYVFDALPKILYDQMYTAPVRNVTADVLVHTGREVYFGINLAIMYTGAVPKSAVDAKVEQLLTAYVESLGFGAAIQLHDFIDIAYNATGVDNVRFVKETEDALNYFIRMFGGDGNTTLYNGKDHYTNDFVLGDDEIPVLQEVNFVQKAQNSW